MLIAIHGAVLTLLVFMRPNSFVAELFFRPYPDPNGMFEVCSLHPMRFCALFGGRRASA